MSFLDKLERRLGFIAIPGLIRAVVTLNALVFVLVLLNKGFDSYLALDIARIRAGEVWRLVTYIFVPQDRRIFLLVVVALWFLWFIGDGLERAWGPFRLTLYFLVGMIGTTVAAVLSNSQFSSQMLFTTLFFAFAHFYPEEIIYVFFILPLKVKWIAWVYAGFLLLGFATQSNSYRLAFIAALSNYLIFFGPGVVRISGSARRWPFGASVSRFNPAATKNRSTVVLPAVPRKSAIPVSSFAWRATARNIASRTFRGRPMPLSDGEHASSRLGLA